MANAALSHDQLELARIDALKAAVDELQASLHRSGGKWTTRANYDLLAYYTAGIAFTDDGDLAAARVILMDELRCDESGDPQDNLVPFAKCRPAVPGGAA